MGGNKMEDNKQVETETTINTEEKVEETPVEETKTEETNDNTETKTFTQAEVDDFVKNRVYQERDSIAKKLGIGEKYSADALNEFITKTSDLKSKYDDINSQIEQFKTENETIKAEKSRIEEDYLVNKFGVRDDGRDEFLTLIKSNVKEGKTLEQSALEISERETLKSLFKSNTPTKVVIGNDKSTVAEQDKYQSEMERLRNL
jgi:hypothetical protein